MKGLRKLIRLAVIAMVIAAVADQLRRPKEERTWFGRVGGLVPYDFRPPSLARLRQTMWNPNDDRILVDTAFGVGWSVNLAAVRGKLTDRAAA